MNQLNENIELLNFIYQNSQMGVNTIDQLIKIVDNKKFKKQLKSQYKEYLKINISVRKKLNKYGYDEKGITAFEKVRTYLMINIQTMKDKTPSHVSEMLIIGSNMGILDATKNLKKYRKSNRKIINLMKELLEIEENNVQQLKKYL